VRRYNTENKPNDLVVSSGSKTQETEAIDDFENPTDL
jgi:hypothetical protein